MTITRPLSFPKLHICRKQGETMAGSASPYIFAPGHSRDSSTASPSPVTPTSSLRSHARWPSSTSSLATMPDSPTNVTKSPLHDLVEDPSEREDSFFGEAAGGPDEPMCICDTAFCEHRQMDTSQTTWHQPLTDEWTPGDDFFGDGELAAARSIKRSRSGENVNESMQARAGRRWPSISQRWRDHRPTTSVSAATVCGTTSSRSSSTRLSSVRGSLAARIGRDEAIQPADLTCSMRSMDSDRSAPETRLKASPWPVDVEIPEPQADPVDREALASTPLLPPMMGDRRSESDENVYSPLMAPSVAGPSVPTSMKSTPESTPLILGLPTPPLSAKPSAASIGQARLAPSPNPGSDIPHLSISQEEDPWALKLGHANFHITPEPYLPEVCDFKSCTRLLEDWESARIEYMRLAARISEHYGPTSRTYKLTKEKWNAIDAHWRSNLEMANAEAEASGEAPVVQSLGEVQTPTELPSLNAPHQPEKFPAVDDSDIVGPMVKYAKIQARPSKKTTTFLRIFTDPTSLLGGRSPFGTRR